MKVIVGNLGWANLDRVPKGQLDAYGPGGRWNDLGTGRSDGGDLLSDALQREGIGGGATLIVVAISRFEMPTADEITAAVLDAAPPHAIDPEAPR